MFGNVPEHWPWRLGRHYEAAAAAGSKEKGREEIQQQIIQARRGQWHLGLQLVIIFIIKWSADYFPDWSINPSLLVLSTQQTKTPNILFTMKESKEKHQIFTFKRLEAETYRLSIQLLTNFFFRTNSWLINSIDLIVHLIMKLVISG